MCQPSIKSKQAERGEEGFILDVQVGNASAVCRTSTRFCSLGLFSTNVFIATLTTRLGRTTSEINSVTASSAPVLPRLGH